MDSHLNKHGKHVKPSWQYKPGDRVYLDAANVRTTRTSKKLDAKFHGPFKVISAVGKSAYKLELPTGWTIHNMFHESKLKPAHEPQFPIQKETRPHPPPDIINRDEEHEVEEVKQVRKRSGKKEFLIKWKGLPQEENTWEPEEHMTNAQGVVRDFIKLILTPSEKRLSPLPRPPATSPSPSLPIPLSLIQKTSFLSTLHTPVYSDGVTNNSTNITNASSTNCGTAGRAHVKKLTRKRTEGGPSLPTYRLRQEMPTPRESNEYSRVETIHPGEISNVAGFPAGFVSENGPIPA